MKINTEIKEFKLAESTVQVYHVVSKILTTDGTKRLNLQSLVEKRAVKEVEEFFKGKIDFKKEKHFIYTANDNKAVYMIVFVYSKLATQKLKSFY